MCDLTYSCCLLTQWKFVDFKKNITLKVRCSGCLWYRRWLSKKDDNTTLHSLILYYHDENVTVKIIQHCSRLSLSLQWLLLPVDSNDCKFWLWQLLTLILFCSVKPIGGRNSFPDPWSSSGTHEKEFSIRGNWNVISPHIPNFDVVLCSHISRLSSVQYEVFR